MSTSLYKWYMFLWCTVAFLLLPYCTASAASPVVLIPGDGASALEIQYEDMSPPHWWCSKSSSSSSGSWERLWIPNLSELLPKNIDCWSQKMILHYNETHVSNAPGVLGIRPLAGAKGLEIRKDHPSEFQDLLDALQSNTNVQVATYDFRLSPRGNPQYLSQLQEMVESAFAAAEGGTDDNQKVTLISHSLGGLVVHHFLTAHVTTEWKQKYIQAWIPLAPAYGGTKITLQQLISGDPESIPWLSGSDVKEEQRSYETSVWLLPDPMFYNHYNSTSATTVGDIIVSTSNKNYTVQDYHELFQDAGFDNFPLQWDRVKNLTLWEEDDGDGSRRRLADPNVTVYPVYGYGVATAETYVYPSSSSLKEDEKPSQIIKSTNGDGTVNLHSLQAGDHWSYAHPALRREGISHVELLSDPKVIQYVHGIVTGGEQQHQQ